MEIPEQFHHHVAEQLTVEFDGAHKRRQWAVVLGLKPVLDGDKWSLLWGDNLQTGVAGFGDTPVDAIEDFERAMYTNPRPAISPPK